jgi:hypothetical protein
MIKMCIAGIFGGYYSHSRQKRDKQKHKKNGLIDRCFISLLTSRSVDSMYLSDFRFSNDVPLISCCKQCQVSIGKPHVNLLLSSYPSVRCQSVNLV